jgi:hypothetical protein
MNNVIQTKECWSLTHVPTSIGTMREIVSSLLGAILVLFLFCVPAEVAGQKKAKKVEVDAGTEDLSKDLEKIQKGAEEGKEIEVPFVRLKKRAELFIGTKVCYEGEVLSVAEDLAMSRIQVAVRTKGETSFKDQGVLVVLGPTEIVEGDLIRFCGTVTGATVIETWAGWTVPAVEFMVGHNEVKKVHKKAKNKKKPACPCPESQDKCKQDETRDNK